MTCVWRSIDTAPKDGTLFWGCIDDDAIAMLWHESFGAFVSSWRRMTMAPGYTINGKAWEDHSPTAHTPTHWMPLPPPPEDLARDLPGGQKSGSAQHDRPTL